MAKRKAFYLYKRQKKHGAYWYVCFINPDTGVQCSAKSIDVLKEKLNLGAGFTVKDRDTAAIIAGKALESGLVFSTSFSMSFNDYCESFWDFDSSEYVKLRNSIKPGSIGKEYCVNMLGNYRNHVKPLIGAKVKLSSVSVDMLDKVIGNALDKGMASGSVQQIVLSFSLPLKEAVRKRLIASNPADHLVKIPRNEKERGILDYDELGSLVTLVDERPEDPVAQAVKLSLSTGMRSGEIRALSTSAIELSQVVREDGTELARINIEKSLAPYSGLKCTKSKRSREVLLDNSFAKQLVAMAGCDGFVFPGLKSPTLSAVALRSGFYSMLEEIGIGEEERRRRNITFHSLRHMFNTLLYDGNVALEDRMLALGHASQSVNERYRHDSERQLVEVSRVSSWILSLSLLGAVKSAGSLVLPSVREDQCG